LPNSTSASNSQRQASAAAAENHRQSLPPGLGTRLPRRRAAAGLEQAQRHVDALAEPDLIEQLRMLAAIALEVLHALERQPAAEVTLDDLVARDELAIHGLGAAAQLRWALVRCLHARIVP
jgi:hypothetical protein